MCGYVVAIHLDSKDYAFGKMDQLHAVPKQKKEEGRSYLCLSADEIEREVAEPMCMIM